jgi:hypothetical protein
MATRDEIEMQKAPSSSMRADANPVQGFHKSRDERELARFGKTQQLRVCRPLFCLNFAEWFWCSATLVCCQSWA